MPKTKNKKNKPKTKEDNNIRVPRPKGYTLSLQEVHNLNNPHKQKIRLNYLKQLLIEQWTTNSNQLQGEHYTIHQLSIYLNTPVPIVMKIMNRVLVRVANFFGKDGDQMQANARAQIFQALFQASESHSWAHKQVSLLAAAQGDTYKPFISGEVNKAIANLIAANKPLQETIKLMLPSQGLTINQNNLQGPSHVNYITTDKAVQMIRDKSQSMISDTSQLEALPELSDALPDISARTQDLTKIGIRNEAFSDKNKGPKGKKDEDKKGPISIQPRASFEHGKRKDLEILDEDESDFRM